MMKSRGSLGLALAVALAGSFATPVEIPEATGRDPHVPRPRSKGEKARNRKHRGGSYK